LTTETSNGVLTVKLVAAIVWVTFGGGLMNWETWPKSNVATLVPEPVSTTPFVSVLNVRLIELYTVAVTVRVPELVCPCAEAKPGIKNKPVSNPANKMALFFILIFPLEIIPS
jgi:hypothetical protein